MPNLNIHEITIVLCKSHTEANQGKPKRNINIKGFFKPIIIITN